MAERRTPVIVLTKADACEDRSNILTSFMIYLGRSKGAGSERAHYCGEGMDELREYMGPSKTLVLLGSSGVGKSSLVNALSGEEIMKVNQIREDDSKGRHTRLHRELIANASLRNHDNRHSGNERAWNVELFRGHERLTFERCRGAF